MLQGATSILFPTHLPPWVASTFIDLVLVLMHPPPELEHSPSIQGDHSQSIGNAKLDNINNK